MQTLIFHNDLKRAGTVINSITQRRKVGFNKIKKSGEIDP